MIRDDNFYIAKQRGLGDILLVSQVVANTSTADIRCVLRGVDIRPAVGLSDGRRRRATSLSYTFTWPALLETGQGIVTCDGAAARYRV